MFANILNNLPVQLCFCHKTYNRIYKAIICEDTYVLFTVLYFLGPRQCRTYHAGTVTGKIEMSLHEDDKTR